MKAITNPFKIAKAIKKSKREIREQKKEKQKLKNQLFDIKGVK